MKYKGQDIPDAFCDDCRLEPACKADERGPCVVGFICGPTSIECIYREEHLACLADQEGP